MGMGHADGYAGYDIQVKPESISKKLGFTIGSSFYQTENDSNKDGDLFSRETRKAINLTNNVSRMLEETNTTEGNKTGG